MSRTKQLLHRSPGLQTAIKRHAVPLKKKSRRTEKHRKLAVKALREIIHLQRTTETLIPRLAFQRMVRDVAREVLTRRGLKDEYRWQSNALLALQEAAEVYLTCLFEDANLATIHARRVTLFPRDLHLLLWMMGSVKEDGSGAASANC